MKTHHPKAKTIARARERIRKVCEFIARHPTRKHTLKELAREAALSPFHFQRSFKRVVGVTPKEYIEAARLRSLKSGLRRTASVTQAIYDAGFGSASRVYERIDTRLGMTPRQYRAGGAGVEVSYACAQTALGCVLIGATDRGICFLQFGTAEEALRRVLAREYPNADLKPMSQDQRGAFDDWMRELTHRIEGDSTPGDVPLDVNGTAFQLKVWKTLLDIPRGAVASYGEIARRVGKPRAVRAVANACARNRIAILVPCHRVIRGDGSLGGYRWGIARKRTLLDRERGVSS
jgi:AraC family transcriptional regulator of adaptative response/methylated-DNA-[protein]-cysteine methyltransferase